MKKWLGVGLAIALCIGVTAGLVSAHTIKQKAKMNGTKEVPGPGDPNGEGVAILKGNDEEGQICYKITFSGIGQAAAAHIHKGTKTESGDVKVTLFEGSKSSPAKGCVDVAAKLIEKIQENPARYYVNVHTGDYPDGAIRGQIKTVGEV
jgi:hypothetical protein